MKKKQKVALAAVVLASALSIQTAGAVNMPELEAEIESCRETQNTAHQMAECARQLGFAEEHIIIQTAQDKWWGAYRQEQEFIRQLEQAREPDLAEFVWDGPVLTKRAGTVQGPSGKETYYNLPMQGVVRIMRNMGFSESEFPFWVREDGVKMLGPYVMVAANLRVHPRGSVVECSLGHALVCDTGGFARSNPYQLDVATNWG